MRIGGNCCQWGEAGPGSRRESSCFLLLTWPGLGEPKSVLRSGAVSMTVEEGPAGR